jgi:hypothetical protein
MRLSSQATMAPPMPPRIEQTPQLELVGWITLRVRVGEMATTETPRSAAMRSWYRPAGRADRVAVPPVPLRVLAESHSVGVP